MEDYLFVKIKGEFTKLVFADIIYIESWRNYVQIVTAKTKIMVKIGISKMEKLLPPEEFFRIHRSYIVAAKAITGFNHNKVHLAHTDLPMSEQYRKALLTRIKTLEDSFTNENGQDISLDH